MERPEPYSDKFLFRRATEIIEYMGQPVPIMELDPFIESKKVLGVNNKIRIERSKTLATDDSGNIHVADMVEVFSNEFDEDTTEYTLVFNAISTRLNYIETFKIIQGEWTKLIIAVSNDIKANSVG